MNLQIAAKLPFLNLGQEISFLQGCRRKLLPNFEPRTALQHQQHHGNHQEHFSPLDLQVLSFMQGDGHD